MGIRLKLVSGRVLDQLYFREFEETILELRDGFQ